MASSSIASALMAMIDADQSSTVTPRLSSGMSPEVQVGGRSGRFNFDVPPETGGTPGTRYAFDTNDGGRWFQQIENAYQGGRWEDAHHAKDDYKRYSGMTLTDLNSLMEAVWGRGNKIGETVSGAASSGLSFDDLIELLSQFNTHRQISYGEPEAKK